jgi:uncharacterized membrane protein YkvA (DUF1232 family)
MLVRLLLSVPYVGQLLRVSWLLFWDRRVFPLLKTLPLAAVVYVLSPIDFLRDFKLGIGQVDDIIVTGVLLTIFVAASPREIVRQHIHGYDDDDGPEPIKGKYRYIDKE